MECGVLAFVFLPSESANTNPRDEAAPSASTLNLNKKKSETYQEIGPGSGKKWQSRVLRRMAYIAEAKQEAADSRERMLQRRRRTGQDQSK